MKYNVFTYLVGEGFSNIFKNKGFYIIWNNVFNNDIFWTMFYNSWKF